MDSPNSPPLLRRSGLRKKDELALIEKLVQETHFSENDVKYILKFYKKFSNETHFIEKPDFLQMMHEVFGYTQHFFMNRVFLQADSNRNGRLTMEEFTRLLSVLLRGTKEEKIRFCFNCYDLNETMQLSRDVIITLLNQTSTEAVEVNPDLVLDLLEMILKKMDQDGDGVLVFEEFKNASLEDWLLIEAFGQCLPDYKCHVSFLEHMAKNIEI